jgi:Uma2 family endonuclease
MALPALPQRRLTFEEYLELEHATQWRWEFVGGEVYAMEGASKRHHLVTGNIYTRLRAAAEGGPCQVFFGGVKLRVGDDIYYPDGVVTCSPSETHKYMILEPCLVIEVTSPSTARTDRTGKRDAYRSIASLQAYLIVEQGWRRVVRHWRDATGAWQETDLQGDGSIPLTCPEVALTLDQIYEGLAPLTVKELEAIGYGVETAALTS